MGPGIFPLDEELELLPGALTPSLQEDLVRLGTWLPFARAATELARLRGVRVSEATARGRTEALGAAYVAVQAAQAAEVAAQEPDAPAVAPTGPDRRFLSVDGAMVGLVGGVWTEVKTLAIGAIEPPVWEARVGEWVVHTSHLSYFSRRAELATFAEAARVETQRRAIATAGVVVAVTDGAEANQTFLEARCPQAVRVLDFPHAAGYLAQAAEAVWGEEPVRRATWLAEQCHELKHGDPAVVLGRLRALLAAGEPAGGALTPAAATALREGLAYLEKREAQIQYTTFRAAGYPIGDGAVESAHKAMIAPRLKGAGMRWAPVHVNPMVALRNVAYNDRWDEAWPQLTAELCQQARTRTAARRQARSAGPLTPAAPVAPTPDQPAPAPSVPAAAAALLREQPTWRDSGPAPAPLPAATPPPSRRPRADHPWRHRAACASAA